LTNLLERASPLHDGDDYYREVLPAELADLRLSPETMEEIIAILCAEISRNPDEAFISAVSFTGVDLAARTIAMVLTNPPRPLTMSEYTYALSLVSKFLPCRLSEDPELLPKADVERLFQLSKEFLDIDEDGPDRGLRIGIRHSAGHPVDGLARYGVS
jgi:hypothetical protein